MQRYTFGASTFKSFVWLNGGATFKNPNMLEIEMVTQGGFSVDVCRSDGTSVGTASRDKAGWSTFHFQTGGEFGAGIPSGDYKIKLTSLDGGERSVKQGSLEYDA